MTFVADANVVLGAGSAPGGFERLGTEVLAPPLLWSEVRSALHVARSRGLIEDQEARATLAAFESGPILERRHRRLGEEAWRIADELGWAKTYDAEYLALASLLDVPIASFDRRMVGAAVRLSIPIHSFDYS